MLTRNGVVKKTLYRTNVVLTGKKKYNNFIRKNENIFLPKKYSFNNQSIEEVQYHILLMKRSNITKSAYYRDFYGKNCEISIDNYEILNIKPFNIETSLRYYNQGSIIYVDELYKYFVLKPHPKQIYYINMYIIIEFDDNIHLFLCKNKEESRYVYTYIRKLSLSSDLIQNLFFNEPLDDNFTRKVNKLCNDLGIKKILLNKNSYI